MTNIVNSLSKIPQYSQVNTYRSKFLSPENKKTFTNINIIKIENSNPSLPPFPSSNIKASKNHAQETSDINFKNNTIERSDKLSEFLRSSLDISNQRVSRSRTAPSHGNIHGLKSPSLVLEAIKMLMPHEKNAIESEFALVPSTALDKMTIMEEQSKVVNQEIDELNNDLLLVTRSLNRSEPERGKVDNMLNFLKENLRNSYYKDKVMSLYIFKHESSNIINQ